MSVELIANAIVAAVTAGAATGATDTAKKAIGDAYSGLKSLLMKKFGSDSTAIEAVKSLEAKPDSQGRQQVLAEELASAKVDSHPEILSSAQSLLELIKALPGREQHTQIARGTGIAQADRGGVANVNIGSTSAKSAGDDFD